LQTRRRRRLVRGRRVCSRLYPRARVFAGQAASRETDAGRVYLPSVASKTTNERRRRRECCSWARHRDSDRAAPRSTAGLPRRRLATGSEAARNWYPSDPCPIRASSFLPCLSSLRRLPCVLAPNSREDLLLPARVTWRRRSDFRGGNARSNPDGTREPLARRSTRENPRAFRRRSDEKMKRKGEVREKARLKTNREFRDAFQLRGVHPQSRVTSGVPCSGEEIRVPFSREINRMGTESELRREKRRREKRRGCSISSSTNRENLVAKDRKSEWRILAPVGAYIRAAVTWCRDRGQSLHARARALSLDRKFYVRHRHVVIFSSQNEETWKICCIYIRIYKCEKHITYIYIYIYV